MTAYDRRSRLLACALAFQAGFVDALGFLHLKGYFVSFMSGNSTQTGVDIVLRLHVAATPAILVLCFVTGVVIGSSTRRIAHRRPTSTVLFLVALGILAAAASFEAGFERATIVLMVLSMGATNAALERTGKASLGVTYVTGALVKVGQHIAGSFFGGDRLAWLWDAMLWGALVVGAIAGATSYEAWALRSLWLPTILALALACGVRMTSFDRHPPT